jgi:hypothetical protein
MTQMAANGIHPHTICTQQELQYLHTMNYSVLKIIPYSYSCSNNTFRLINVFQFGWPSAETKLGYSLTLMVLQYFFPISVLIFTYTRIAITLWRTKPPGENENAQNHHQRISKAKRKVHPKANQMILPPLKNADELK